MKNYLQTVALWACVWVSATASVLTALLLWSAILRGH